jgi:hypothetical protein
MPLVFIHGVNTRDTDEDYVRTSAARRTMFEELVVPAVVQRGFPGFAVADDIYWGDLGVNFGWNLRTIPATQVLQSLGPAVATAPNLDLLQLVSETQPAAGAAVEKLGPDSALAAAAQKDPAALVRVIFAPEADRFAPLVLPPAAAVNKADAAKAAAQGQHLALMLIAVESLARDAGKNPALVQGKTDNEVLDKIQKEVTSRYQTLAQPRLSQQVSDTEHLGNIFGNAIGWAADHLKGAINAAKKAASSAVAETERGASLLALKELRDSISRRGLRFLGDVFVYLHDGRTAAPAIFDRVKTGILALNGKKNNQNEREPFIVVTHSFGSEILYDLLTSGDRKSVV